MQPNANLQSLVNEQLAAKCLFSKSYELATGKWQLTSHSECQFTYSYARIGELATENWQPDANSI